jgi:hypothetical protein
MDSTGTGAVMADGLKLYWVQEKNLAYEDRRSVEDRKERFMASGLTDPDFHPKEQ